jgi:hypothetical protein
VISLPIYSISMIIIDYITRNYYNVEIYKLGIFTLFFEFSYVIFYILIYILITGSKTSKTLSNFNNQAIQEKLDYERWKAEHEKLTGERID